MQTWKIALALGCLIRGAHGRRVTHSREQTGSKILAKDRGESYESTHTLLNAIAKLLLAFAPVSSVIPFGSRMHLAADNPTIAASFPAVSTRQSRLERRAPAIGMSDEMPDPVEMPDPEKLKKKLSLERQFNGPEHPDTLKALREYAYALVQSGNTLEAEPLLKEALNITRNMEGESPEQQQDDVLRALSDYAKALWALGRVEEVEAVDKEFLDLTREVMGEEDANTLSAMNNYAVTLRQLGRDFQATLVLKEVLDLNRKIHGEKDPETLPYLINYAQTLSDLGRHDEAEPLLKDAVEITREIHGPKAQQTLTAMTIYAQSIWKLDRKPQAMLLFKEILDTTEEIFGPDDPKIIPALETYAWKLMDSGRGEEGTASLSRLAVLQMKANSTFTQDLAKAGMLQVEGSPELLAELGLAQTESNETAPGDVADQS